MADLKEYLVDVKVVATVRAKAESVEEVENYILDELQHQSMLFIDERGNDVIFQISVKCHASGALDMDVVEIDGEAA